MAPSKIARRVQFNNIWALTYALYMLIAIGLIIISSITLKFGNDFFANPNANPAVTSGTSGETGENEGTAVTQQQRRNALVESGVGSSAGVASGVLSLVFNLISLVVQLYLDKRWETESKTDELYYRVMTAIVMITINGILFAGNIALGAGLIVIAQDVRNISVGTAAGTPHFLVGAAVMAILSGIMAAFTVVVDLAKKARASKEAARLGGEQSRRESLEVGEKTA